MATKRKTRSPVWEFFTRIEDQKEATCNQCQLVLQISSGSTSPPLRHLFLIHKIDCSSNAKRGKVADTEMSLDEIIARMAAVDELPFSTIANSSVIRYLIHRNHHSLPASPTTICSITMKYFEDKKRDLIKQLHDMKQKGSKFTVSTDEWTSVAKRRYTNVNLHCQGQIKNLGLTGITGSFTAKACLAMLKSKLQEFEVDLSDVFAVVTDGASVMTRFGQDSDKQHQLCLAHGIHLAVTDVFYHESSHTETSVSESESETESDNLEGDDEDELDSYFMVADEEITYEAKVNDVVSKVRMVVKMFRNSPKKLEVLQKYTVVDKTPILDIKTRWNSMLNMMERFHELKIPIQKALLDLNRTNPISEEEFVFIGDIVPSLQPVKLAAEAICRASATLISADVAIEFMLTKLSQLSSELSQNLFAALKMRLLQRRTPMSEVCWYLHFGEIADSEAHRRGYFDKISRQTIIQTIKSIYGKLYSSEAERLNLEEREENTDESISLLANLDVSLEAELRLAIREAESYVHSKNPQSRSIRDLGSAIRRDMQIFESSGKRGSILQKVYNVLLAVPPTSVEAERVFSSANNFCRKTRSRLGDKTLSALVFLKSTLKPTD